MDNLQQLAALIKREKELLEEYEKADGPRRIEIIREVTNVGWDLRILRHEIDSNS